VILLSDCLGTRPGLAHGQAAGAVYCCHRRRPAGPAVTPERDLWISAAPRRICGQSVPRTGQRVHNRGPPSGSEQPAGQTKVSPPVRRL